MRDSSCSPTHLRLLAAGQPHGPEAGEPDDWLSAGLPCSKVHELFAAEPGDASAATGFCVALALAAGAMPLLWLRTEAAELQGGRLHGTGFLELGLDPETLVVAIVADERALLRTAADAARCQGLGMLVVEAWGRAPGLDLTATRRLQLAAEASGATVLLLRVAGKPQPSAAATRWGVTACPSTALPAATPGRPAYFIDLQRRRGGPSGQRWRVEWDRDTRRFDTAPLFGAGLSMAPDRAAASDPPAPVRLAG